MFSDPSILQPLWQHLSIAAAVLVASVATGRLLGDDSLHGRDRFFRLVSMMVIGLLFLVGIGVTVIYQRLGIHTLVPLILIGYAAWVRQRPMSGLDERYWLGGGNLLLPITCVLVAVGFFNSWNRELFGPDGLARLGHSDLGYYAMLAKELPEAKVSHHWTAVMGSSLADAGLAKDQWYHWGPVWLGMVIAKVTGLPALEAVLNIGEIVMITLVVLISGAIIQRLTRWNVTVSLFVGLISVALMPFPQHLRPVIIPLLPNGWLQHCRDGLLWQFSYLFEAFQVAFIALTWLRGRKGTALVLVLCATFSSPHLVGGLGVAAGALMLLGVAMRDREIWKPAALMVMTILTGWAFLHYGIGVQMATGLGSGEGVGLFGFDWNRIQQDAGKIISDIGIEVLLGILLVPGWVALIRIKKDDLPSEARFLGWLAIAGLMGGTAAFHLFSHEEKFHFTDFPMVLIATPIAAWGLALWISRSRGWIRAVPVLALLLALASGVEDLAVRKQALKKTTISQSQLTSLKKQLNGRPFGYFTSKDRPWWIPQRGYLAAVLDSRCIRLNPLQSADVSNRFSKFYNSFEIMALVPYGKGEPVHRWSMKLTEALGIRYILKSKGDPIPPEIEDISETILKTGDLTLYRLPLRAKPLSESASPPIASTMGRP